MPPKSTAQRRNRPSPYQMELRMTNLYNRLAHPASPTAPEVIDRDIVRLALEGAGWNVDLAERRHRLYRRSIRERNAAAASAAQQAPNNLAASSDPADEDQERPVNDTDCRPDPGSDSGSGNGGNGGKGKYLPVLPSCFLSRC